MQLLEDRAESTPRAVQPPTGGHRETPQNRPDLCRREALPLREEQDLAISRAEPVECFVHQRLLRVEKLLRSGLRFACQPFIERASATARPALIRDHLPGRRVQPDPGRIAFGERIQSAPGGEEHLGRRVLRIGRTGPPAAIRDDVRAVRGEERVEPAPSLAVTLVHLRTSDI